MPGNRGSNENAAHRRATAAELKSDAARARAELRRRRARLSGSNSSSNAAEHRAEIQRGGPMSTGSRPSRSSGSGSSGSSIGSSTDSMEYLRQMLGGGSTDHTDYTAAATKIYQPALDYIRQQSTDATHKAHGYDRNLKDMYGGVVRDIGHERAGIDRSFNDSIRQVSQNTAQGTAAIDSTYDSAATEQAAMLKKLGIQAAGPDVLAEGSGDEAFFKALTATTGRSNADLLRTERAGAEEFNTSQQGITRQSGVDARASNQSGLQDVLGKLRSQGVDLKTQIGTQAASMQSSAAEQQLRNSQAMLAQMNADRSFQLQQQGQQNSSDLGRARLNLDTARYQTGSGSSSTAAEHAVDPWGKGTELALQLYGNPTGARSAIDHIRNAITEASNSGNDPSTWTTPQQMVDAVMKKAHGTDERQLTALATYLFQQIYK